MSTKTAIAMPKSAITVAPKQSPPKEVKVKDTGKTHRRSRSGTILNDLTSCARLIVPSRLFYVSSAEEEV